MREPHGGGRREEKIEIGEKVSVRRKKKMERRGKEKEEIWWSPGRGERKENETRGVVLRKLWSPLVLSSWFSQNH